jgi:hypothetical protein
MLSWTPEQAMALVAPGRLEPIFARPGFERVLRHTVEGWLPRPGDPKALANTLRDLGRLVSGYWALYLDASPGGLTLARLTKLIEGTHLSSPGRARALLLYMRFLGYIEPVSGEANRALDGRERRYRVTGRLTRAFHERYRRDLEPFLALDPDIAEIYRGIDNEAVFRTFAWAHGGFLAALFKSYGPQGESLDTFSSRFSGMVVLALLLLSGEPDDVFPPERPVRYTVAALARTAGISRAQVNRLLREAQKAGFMSVEGKGLMRLTPVLAFHVRFFVAGCVVIIGESARAALTHLEQAEVA